MAEPLAVCHSLNSLQSSGIISNRFLNFYIIRPLFPLQIGMVVYELLMHPFIYAECLDMHSFIHIFRLNFKSFVKNLKMIDRSSADTETAEQPPSFPPTLPRGGVVGGDHLEPGSRVGRHPGDRSFAYPRSVDMTQRPR